MHEDNEWGICLVDEDLQDKQEDASGPELAHGVRLAYTVPKQQQEVRPQCRYLVHKLFHIKILIYLSVTPNQINTDNDLTEPGHGSWTFIMVIALKRDRFFSLMKIASYFSDPD